MVIRNNFFLLWIFQQPWCSIYTKKTALTQINLDSHSNGKYRFVCCPFSLYMCNLLQIKTYMLNNSDYECVRVGMCKMTCVKVRVTGCDLSCVTWHTRHVLLFLNVYNTYFTLYLPQHNLALYLTLNLLCTSRKAHVCNLRLVLVFWT